MERSSVGNRKRIVLMLLYAAISVLVMGGFVGLVIWVGERIDRDRTYFTKQAQESAVEAAPAFAEEYYSNNGNLLVRIRQLNPEYSQPWRWDVRRDWEKKHPGKALVWCSMLDAHFMDCGVYTKVP